MDVPHVIAAVLASWRLTEIITMDRISEPLRKHFPHYLWGCPRCVSIWAGSACTLIFIYAPWLNWPFAMAWLYLVEWDWRQRAWGTVANRVQAEVERLALEEQERRKRDLASTPVLTAKGFIPVNGR